MEIPVSFSSGVKSSDGFSWARLSFRVQWFVFRWRFVSSLEVARNYLGNYFVPVLVSNSESPVSKSPHCRAKADIGHSLRAWTRFFPSFKISDQTNHLFLLLSLSLLNRVVLELFIDENSRKIDSNMKTIRRSKKDITCWKIQSAEKKKAVWTMVRMFCINLVIYSPTLRGFPALCS